MSLFELWIKEGFFHILDPKAYDHILYVIALALPFGLAKWKPLLWHITGFTVGHSVALALSVFVDIPIPKSMIEFLIIFSIIITAALNMLGSDWREKLTYGASLLIGCIHGLGFGNYFKLLNPESSQEMAVSLLSFNLGVEAGQVIIILMLLLFLFLAETLGLSHQKVTRWISFVILIVALHLCIKFIIG